MKSVTLLFPSAKARLRGPLQPKPSFQPASSFRESKHTAPRRARPLLPENVCSLQRGMAGGIAGRRRAARRHQDTQPWHCKAPTGWLLTLGPQEASRQSPTGCKRRAKREKTRSNGNKEIPPLRYIAYYGKREKAAVQGKPVQKRGCTSSLALSHLLKTGPSHRARRNKEQRGTGLLSLHRAHPCRCRQKEVFLQDLALTWRRTTNSSLLSACISISSH